jgi:hypothetical protein
MDLLLKQAQSKLEVVTAELLFFKATLDQVSGI